MRAGANSHLEPIGIDPSERIHGSLIDDRSPPPAPPRTQQSALDRLTTAVDGMDLKEVSGDYGPDCLGGDHAVEPRELLLLRFLRGNGFNVNRALSQVCALAVSHGPSDLEIGPGCITFMGAEGQSVTCARSPSCWDRAVMSAHAEFTYSAVFVTAC